MLRGDDNSVNLQGDHRAIFALLVTNGHLSLAVRSQPPERSILADIGQLLAQTSCNQDSQGHGDLGLIRSVTKHDSLISCTHIHLVLADVDTACNVRTLLVDAYQDLACLVAQTLAVNTVKFIFKRGVANAFDSRAHNLVIVKLRAGGDLSEDHDHVVFAGTLTCNL